jgi:putative transposase
LVTVKPATVITWQRKRFREHWANLCRNGKPGRPPVAKEIRDLIQKMSMANPGWGSPRIVGELRKLGIEVAKSTVEKYMIRLKKSSSPTWKAFLENHVMDLFAIDFFTVATIRFEIQYVLVVLCHQRRRVVYFNVTENPNYQWSAQQIVEAFAWKEAPQYLLHDRDKIFRKDPPQRMKNMGIKKNLISPRSPWQNPYVERLIGSVRRECLDHVIVMNQRHLKRILIQYYDYYHQWRTHLSLEMDCPKPREVQPKSYGKVIEVPEVGGLHHHYERRAA